MACPACKPLAEEVERLKDQVSILENMLYELEHPTTRWEVPSETTQR